MADVIIKVKAEDEATAELSKLDKSLKGMKVSFTELNQALEIVKKAWRAVNRVIDETVGVTMSYVKEVKDVSRALGINAQEASKLIQIGDDLQVSTETLKLAFKAALQQGITPTVENLKKMAAEYQKLQTPVEKAQYAIKNFGRAGMEMQKFLEATPDQLDAMAKSAENAGLVMSDEAMKATEDYRVAMDDLDDTVKGLKVSIGNELIPELSNLLKTLNEIASAIDLKTIVSINNFIRAFQGGYLKEYIESMKLLERETKGTVIGMQDFALEMQRAGVTTQTTTDATEKMTTQTAEERHQIDLIRKSFTSYTGVVKIVDKATDGAAQAMGFYAKRAQAAALNSRHVAQAMNLITDAQDALTAAQEEWTKGVGQDAADLLAQSLPEGSAKLLEAYAALDKYTGTNLVEQAKYNAELDAATAAYKSGGLSADEYGQAIADIGTKYEDLCEPIKAAREELDKVNADWAYLLANPVVDLTVNLHYNVDGTPPPGTGWGNTPPPESAPKDTPAARIAQIVAGEFARMRTATMRSGSYNAGRQ